MSDHSSYIGSKNSRFESRWIGRTEWIVVPAKKQWFVLPFLTIWLLGWTAGGLIALNMLITGPDRVFIAIWLVGWAFGWIFANSTIAWQASGQYRITLTDGAMLYAWSMPLLKRESRYELEGVRQLAAVERFDWPLFGPMTAQSTMPPFLQRFSFPNRARSISFLYNDSAVSLDLGLNEEKTNDVLDWLKKKAVAALNQAY
ncbi:MAG: hypothetical protein AAF559_09290 [Pseudomonadota bacterium]